MNNDKAVAAVTDNITQSNPRAGLAGGFVCPPGCGMSSASKRLGKRFTCVIANRITNSGQIAYVDPQSCCDIKHP